MSNEQPVFNTLDRGREIAVRERNLPHWFQPGTAIFITFRTADSLPKDVVLTMQKELEDWLRIKQLPAELALSVLTQRRVDHDHLLKALTRNDSDELRRLLARLYHWSLDDCHGKCVLREPNLAAIVFNAIRHGDGSQFDLDRFVIMPNHVHAIVQFRTGFDLSIVGQSWMRFSARQINPLIGNKGAFWQPEPFDHIIRNAEQFVWLQDYIADNPRKANLRDGEFAFWSRNDPQATEQ